MLFTLRVLLCVSSVGLTAPAFVEAAEARKVVEAYVASQLVDSEFAYLSLRRFKAGALIDDKRLVVMTRRDGDARATTVRVQRPEEVAGSGTLFIDRADHEPKIFLFLPSVGEVKRVTGTGRSSPFFDSDFTFEDVLREVPRENLYELHSDSVVNGEACYVIEARPVEPVSSAYRLRTLYIAKETNRLQRIEFYKGANEPAKVFDAFGYGASSIRGDSRRPERAVMVNHRQGTTTVIRLIESRLNADLEPTWFTPEGLEKMKPGDVDRLLMGFRFDTTR
jgi:hypothetical protein